MYNKRACIAWRYIEDFLIKPVDYKAIILLLPRTDVKVLEECG